MQSFHTYQQVSCFVSHLSKLVSAQRVDEKLVITFATFFGHLFWDRVIIRNANSRISRRHIRSNLALGFNSQGYKWTPVKKESLT